MDTFTYNGITYTQQADGTWRGSNGSTVSKAAGDAMRSAIQPAGGDDSKVLIRTFNDGSQRRSTDGGVTWTVIDPAPAKEQTPDKNLGAGVFQDAAGYYVLDQTGSSPTDRRKRYITEGEAARLTSGPADSTAAGNLAARYAELALSQRTLDQRIQQDAIDYQLALQKQRFYEEQSLFERAIGNERIALEKQGLALQEASTAQQYELSIAGMQQQRDIINAQMQQQTAQFNAQMGFQVEQANVENERARQQQIQGLGRDIAGYAADPGDRAALASFVLANTGFGRAADTAGVDLRTDESLTPLELALRSREDVMAQPTRPYTFNPLAAPQLPGLQMPARITPTTPKPQLPTAQELLMQGAVPTAETARDFEARPTTAAETLTFLQGQQGAGVQRPDWVMQKAQEMALPQMEEGGVTTGAFIAGDSSDGKENQEVVIPDFPAPGMTTVVPKAKLTPKMKAHLGKMQKMQDGGVFQSGVFGGLGSDRTRARSFLDEAITRARAGTPFERMLPDLSYEATPGFDPFVSSLVQGLRSSAQGLPTAWQQRQVALITPPGIREGVVGRSR